MQDKYCYASGDNYDARFIGSFDTLKDCQKEVKFLGLSDVEYGRYKQEWVPTLDFSRIIEYLKEDAYDVVGDVAEDWLDFYKAPYKLDELENELQAVFESWMKKHDVYPKFYDVEIVYPQ